MDYTPVALTNGGHPPRTTVGHELALSVVFESGLLHFADRTSAYRELPPASQQWLKAIPVAWDETRLLGGFPGKWLVVARRQGTDWYLGGINGQDQPQPVALEWRFLADGKYALRLIEDGARDRSFADRQLTVDRTQPLELRLPPGYRLTEPRPHPVLDPVRAILDADPRFLHNPFLMPAMADAVERISSAVESGERILVFGDRDVDGITSTILLHEVLETATERGLVALRRSSDPFSRNCRRTVAQRSESVDVMRASWSDALPSPWSF